MDMIFHWFCHVLPKKLCRGCTFQANPLWHDQVLTDDLLLSSLTNEREIQTLVFDLGGRSITVIVIITITISIIIISSSSFAFIRLRSPSSSALRIHQRNIAQLVPITTILTTMRQRCGEKKGDDLRIGHRLGILWYSWTILDPVFRLSGFSPAHNVV